MSAGKLARQLEADDAGFSENSHHPEPTVGAQNSFYDDPVETSGPSATEAFFLWLKAVTHDGESLLPKEEILIRVISLVYLLDRGKQSIAQLAAKNSISRSTLHRKIRIISERTGLKVPHQKKARSASTERAPKQSANHVRDDHRYV